MAELLLPESIRDRLYYADAMSNLQSNINKKLLVIYKSEREDVDSLVQSINVDTKYISGLHI